MKAGASTGPKLSLGNRQRAVHLNLRYLHELGVRAVPICLRYPGRSEAVLPELEEVEVLLVSDRTIAGVHRRFMNIPGATDVITFAHGEIIVSAATASREAAERGEPLERETLRYIVHGLLHLNGHEDATSDEAVAMWKAQEAIVGMLWLA